MYGRRLLCSPQTTAIRPPFFSRNQVANVLHQVAVLLELQGANVFRVRSYQNASRLLGSLSEDLGELVASGEIYDMKGIGKGLGSALTQAVSMKGDGPMIGLTSTRRHHPASIEMLGIPGLGPKRIKLMADELGVDSVASLKEAALNNQIAHEGLWRQIPTAHVGRH